MYVCIYKCTFITCSFAQCSTEEPKASPSQKKKKKKKRGKKGRRGDDSSEEEHVPRPTVDTTMGEMPEGAMESDGEGKGKERKMDDLSMALDQNLDM